jgi:cell division protein FtsB
MKTLIPFQRFRANGITFMVLTCLITILSWSCRGGSGGAGEKLRYEQLNEVRENVLSEISSLNAEISHRIKYLKEEEGKAGDELRNQLRAYREELERQKELLENETRNIKGATHTDWNDVVENTSSTINLVSQKVSEISREVRELLEN